jgi:hypothetical protein
MPFVRFEAVCAKRPKFDAVCAATGLDKYTTHNTLAERVQTARMDHDECNAVAAVDLFERRGAVAAAPSPAATLPDSPEARTVMKMLDSLSVVKRALEEMRTQLEELVATDMPLRTPQLDEVSIAAETLCLLQDPRPQVSTPQASEPGAADERRKSAAPARKKSAARARKKGCSKNGCSNVGRPVSVLWVPLGFDDAREPAIRDLVPYLGVVVSESRASKHSHCKRGNRLLIRYTDGQLAWAKKDKLLKFLD